MAMFSKNIGPCELVYDSTPLGLTKGGTTFTCTRSTVKTVADKTGETAREKLVTGDECLVKAAITEATLEQLAKIVGGTATGSTAKQLKLQNKVGTNLIDTAKTLTLKPLVAGAVDETAANWIVIPKATINPTFEVPFDLANQKVWGLEAEGHPLTADDVASGGTFGDGTWEEGDIALLGKAS